MIESALGFDFGVSTGVAVARRDGGGPLRIETHPINLGKPDWPEKERLGVFVEELDRLIDEVAPDAIAYEEVSFAVKGRGALWIRRCEGYLLGACYRNGMGSPDHPGILVHGINVMTLKSWARKNGSRFVEKSGMPTKEMMIERAAAFEWVDPEEIPKRALDDCSDAAWAAHWIMTHASPVTPDDEPLDLGL